MKAMKRLLCLMLVAMMLVSTIPMAASAWDKRPGGGNHGGSNTNENVTMEISVMVDGSSVGVVEYTARKNQDVSVRNVFEKYQSTLEEGVTASDPKIELWGSNGKMRTLSKMSDTFEAGNDMIKSITLVVTLTEESEPAPTYTVTYNLMKDNACIGSAEVEVDDKTPFEGTNINHDLAREILAEKFADVFDPEECEYDNNWIEGIDGNNIVVSLFIVEKEDETEPETKPEETKDAYALRYILRNRNGREYGTETRDTTVKKSELKNFKDMVNADFAKSILRSFADDKKVNYDEVEYDGVKVEVDENGAFVDVIVYVKDAENGGNNKPSGDKDPSWHKSYDVYIWNGEGDYDRIHTGIKNGERLSSDALKPLDDTRDAEFKGWYYKDTNNKVERNDRLDVNKANVEIDGNNIYIVAKWDEKDDDHNNRRYDVRIKYDNGKNDTVLKDKRDGADLDLKTPEKHGHKFVGYFYKDTNNQVRNDELDVSKASRNDLKDGEITIEARWERKSNKEYDVYVDYGRKKDDVEHVELREGDQFGKKLLRTDLKRDGYDFQGYKFVKELRGTSDWVDHNDYVDGDRADNRDRIYIKAIWTEKDEDAKVYLEVYVNGITKRLDRRIDVSKYAEDGKISRSEAEKAVENYYKPVSGKSLKYTGLFDKHDWDRYCDDKKVDGEDYIRVDLKGDDDHVYIMVDNVKNPNRDHSNPKTGDNIFTALTVMGLSAGTLALAFVFNKKRLFK